MVQTLRSTQQQDEEPRYAAEDPSSPRQSRRVAGRDPSPKDPPERGASRRGRGRGSVRGRGRTSLRSPPTTTNTRDSRNNTETLPHHFNLTTFGDQYRSSNLRSAGSYANNRRGRGQIGRRRPTRSDSPAFSRLRPTKRVKLDSKERTQTTTSTNDSQTRGQHSSAPLVRRQSRKKLAIPDDLDAPESNPPKLLSPVSVRHAIKTDGDHDHLVARGRQSSIAFEEPTKTRSGASYEHPLKKGGVLSQEQVLEKQLPSHKDGHGTRERREKRTLRSHAGGSRLKSDLALFFPGYEDIISNEPRSQDILTAETKIFIIDDEKPTALAHRPHLGQPTTPTKQRRNQTTTKSPNTPHGGLRTSYLSPNGSPSAAFKVYSAPKLHNTQKVDFSSIEKAAGQVKVDPLSEAFYQKAHRRAERREKQLRNIEKNKAQHEKDNLERLLENLRGPDWLRAMGISGITETEKREFEPKRDFFIHEVSLLLAKFKAWKEEEKRRKLEKEQALVAEEEEGEEEEREGEGDGGGEEVEQEDEEKSNTKSSPDGSIVDAWAAKQLHREAKSAPRRRSSQLDGASLQSVNQPPAQQQTEEKPFTSFYSKPYLRDAAIGQHRRSGRSVTAFGHPLPELPEFQEFQLPPEILTEEAQIANARRRRRLKRESKDGG